MKPKPTRSTRAATGSAPSSSSTPGASSTSALPQRLLAARLPCLATGWQSAATSKPAAVDTLNVPAASPPVPQVSTARRCAGSDTWIACSRMTRARPVTSSTVSPFRRSAVKNAPSCEGVAVPVMISSIADAASVSLSDCPATRWPIASRIMCASMSLRGELYCLGDLWRVAVYDARLECAAGIRRQQRRQVCQRGLDVGASPSVLRLHRDDGPCGIVAGGALVALPPAPTLGEDEAGVVAEDDLTRRGMLDRAAAERRIALAAVREAHRQRPLQRAGVEDGDGQAVADADQSAEVHQRVDAGDVALLGEPAQERFGRAAALRRVHAEPAKGAAPSGEGRQLAEWRLPDARPYRFLFDSIGLPQRPWRRAVGHALGKDDTAGDVRKALDEVRAVAEGERCGGPTPARPLVLER